MPLLFVYGTLKRGCRNHPRLAGQRFVAEARTRPGYILYTLGDYPGLVHAPTDREGVCGELWEVDAAALARLDDFEGVSEDLYRREPIPLLPPHADINADTYVYSRPLQAAKPIGPVWRE